jgi:hypothetical protein
MTMDEQERARLEKEYALLCDEDLKDMLDFDKDEYEEGVYEIIVQEAKRRGLTRTSSPLPSGSKGQDKWFSVYKFSDLAQAEALEAVLNAKGIAVEIVQDGCYTCSRSLSIVPETGVVRVRADQVDQARRLVDEFEQRTRNTEAP